ncbi:hypothetical protein [Nocardioides marmoribigeumensis]|uniref:Uncharacterized protein n=1 Tax=Nocardioides marmoribigeumensis TaxID=433649 RepID=A0ABU2BXL4_9ACTN|nr:hypothetical protein [Nocardioides marmoribigeumensis]MDR7363132.1 hypothetical protein [Nocardioides marmoribigeumensis]
MSGPAAAGLEDRVGFALTVPESWFELDLAPATRDDAVRRLVEDRLRGQQELWEARQGVMRILREEAATAWDSGAAYAACLVHPTDEGPITASLTVSLVRGPVGAEDTQDLLGTLETVPRTDDGRFTSVTAVRLGDAPADCARSYGVDDLPVAGGYVRTVFMQTFVRVPGMNKYFVVSAGSPVVALAEDLLDLFDAITGTFRVVPLEPTASTARTGDR